MDLRAAPTLFFLPNGTNVPSVINSVARVPALQRPSAGRWSSHCHHSSSLLATHRLLHSINRPPLISHRKYAQTPLYKPVRVKLKMKETVEAVEIQVTPPPTHPPELLILPLPKIK